MTRKILFLATLTLLGFPLIGWLLWWLFTDAPFSSIWHSDYDIFIQITLGSATGFVAGWLAWVMIRSQFMEPVRNKYSNLIGSFELKPAHIIYISLCAGIGEEILFRGVIQPFLGIWITAILFVAIHGYLNPKNWRLMIYGVYLTLVIVVVGWQAKHFGLISAIAAHTVIDIVLLQQMSKPEENETHRSEFPFTGDE